MTDLVQARGGDPVLRCAAYAEGHREDTLSLAQAAAARNGDRFVWVELTEPTHQDIAAVAAEFGLPELAVADAVAAHQRPKLEVHGDVLLVVLKPVHYVDSEEVVEVTEIALFLGRHFVVTVRHGQTEVLDRIRAEFEHGSEHPEFGATEVLYRAADRVVDGYQTAIDCILDDVDDIEVQVFGGGDDDRTERIYKLKREVAEFRRAVSPLARTLERLADGRLSLLASEAPPYFRGVHDHLLRAAESVEAIDRLLTDVLAANVAQVSVRQSQISLRQNEDMRKISAWAAIALVPTAIAGIYGMNFDHMPELRWQYGYPMVLTLIGTICLALYRHFRRSNWL